MYFVDFFYTRSLFPVSPPQYFVITKLCDPIIVLAEGSVLFKGSAEEVKKNEKVIESYLGKGIKK